MILCCFLLLISLRSVVAAEPVSYWVLGSFSSSSSAAVEQERLQTLLGTPLEVRRSNQGGYYRVLLEAGRLSLAALTAQSLDAWLLKLDTSTTEAGITLEADPAESTELASSELLPDATSLGEKLAENTETSPLFEPLKEAESLADYCNRLPDSRLCQHPLAAWTLRHEARLNRGQKSLQTACSEPLSSRSAEICLRWQNQQ